MALKNPTITVPLGKGADFKTVYRLFGGKVQKNIPFTTDILTIVGEQGGTEYVLKLVLRDLQEKKILPEGYECLLDFD